MKSLFPLCCALGLVLTGCAPPVVEADKADQLQLQRPQLQSASIEDAINLLGKPDAVTPGSGDQINYVWNATPGLSPLGGFVPRRLVLTFGPDGKLLARNLVNG